jgi:preprotein translocase subunit SecG
MTTLFWIGIVLHVFLCLFLMLLVLVQNDKMGGLAGLGGMTSQSAFSTAGAATFVHKLTRVVGIIYLVLVFALGYMTIQQDRSAKTASALKQATEQSAAPQAAPQLPAATLPAEAAPEAPIAPAAAE